MIKDQDRRSALLASNRTVGDFTERLIEPFSQLRTEVDRLIDGFPFRMPDLRLGRFVATPWPPVETSETKTAYKVAVELPGMNPEEIDISMDDGVLRIAGEKQEQREEDEQGFHVSERSYGAFERLIRLPAAADESQVKAKFKDGLLAIKVGKSTTKQARRIKVDKET